MGTALGLIGIALFIVAVIAFAAGVTWLVVKVSPGGGDDKDAKPASARAG